MARIVVLVVGLGLLGFLSYFMVVGGDPNYDPYGYAAATGGPVGYRTSSVSPAYSGGSGPEWDKLVEAQGKGSAGYPDVQKAMLSTDYPTAESATRYLADSHDYEAFMFFFEQLPNVDARVKDSVRTGWFTDDVYLHAAQVVNGTVTASDPQRAGALLFLKLPYSPTSRSANLADQVHPELVKAVPTANGAFAEDLAYAIAQYPPNDPTPLLDMLAHKSDTARETALKALGKMGLEETLDEVKKLKSDSSARVRLAAAIAESSIETAAATYYSAPAYAASTYTSEVYGEESPAARTARQSARKRLGMP